MYNQTLQSTCHQHSKTDALAPKEVTKSLPLLRKECVCMCAGVHTCTCMLYVHAYVCVHVYVAVHICVCALSLPILYENRDEEGMTRVWQT